MIRLRTGWDLDGPGYGLVEAVRDYRHQHQGVPMESMPLPQRHSVYQAWGMTLAEFITCTNRGVNEGFIFRHGEPTPGFIEALRTVYDAGHEVHIITARDFGDPGMCEKSTREWLAEHRAPFHSLTFSHDKTCLRTDLMIEDHVGNYDALEQAGSESWLLNRPWNEPHDDGRRRVDSLDQFAARVLARAEEAA